MTDRELLRAIKERLEIAYKPNLSPIEAFGGQTQEGRLRRQAAMAEAAIFALGMLEGVVLDAGGECVWCCEAIENQGNGYWVHVSDGLVICDLEATPRIT